MISYAKTLLSDTILSTKGGIQVLYGNIVTEGAPVKTSAVEDMKLFQVFNNEDECYTSSAPKQRTAILP